MMWVKLKGMKDLYPLEVIEYVRIHKLKEVAAFAWWIPHYEKMKKRMINKVKSEYWETTHKYGIRIPKNIEEAEIIDTENMNTIWGDACMKLASKITALLFC